MQTFLPYSNFKMSANCLDNKRLGKQRVEAYQILKILLGEQESQAWKNHPAVKMWKGHEKWLYDYIVEICSAWKQKGFKDTVYVKSTDLINRHKDLIEISSYPEFINNKEFLSSHQSNLLRKNSEFYSQFGWKVKENLEYVWPIYNIII